MGNLQLAFVVRASRLPCEDAGGTPAKLECRRDAGQVGMQAGRRPSWNAGGTPAPQTLIERPDHEALAKLARSTQRLYYLAGQLVSAAHCRRPGLEVRVAHDDRFYARRPGHHRAGPLDVLQCRAKTSWESVYYLQYQVLGGWLLRAIHFYTGQATLLLVGIYLVQMVLRGTYRAPREFLFWTVLLMGLATLGLNLTGDLLSWDQNSFWATGIRVAYLSHAPAIGPWLAKLAIGGPQFGTLTITRFLALHVGVCTAALLGLVLLHARIALRHGLEAAAGTVGQVANLPETRQIGNLPARAVSLCRIGRNRPGATRLLASSCWRSSSGYRQGMVFPVRRPASNWAPGQSGR